MSEVDVNGIKKYYPLLIAVLIIVSVSIALFMYDPYSKSSADNSKSSKDLYIYTSSKIINITAGNFAQDAVYIVSDSYEYAVSLTATGMPSNVEISFKPQHGVIPSFASIMLIKTNPDVEKKDYNITINGTGSNNITQWCNFTLSIK